MKYQLEPYNRDCPDEELLEDLLAISKKIGTGSLTKEQYNNQGRFCAATMQKRFGSWNKALTLSGLSINHRMNIPEEELLSDIKRVAAILNLNTVTCSEYRRYGRFSEITTCRRFGTWSAALKAAGLKPTRWKPPATEEDMLDNMANVWEHVGKQPKQKDFHAPISRYSSAPYLNHFGSWRNALEAFVAATSAEQEIPLFEDKPISFKKDETKQLPVQKTGRNPSWRLRFLVLQRDNFACRLCGASPAKDSSVSLHVDHIYPWSRGGETVLSNLQTCCAVCNIGKSDLPMEESKER